MSNDTPDRQEFKPETLEFLKNAAVDDGALAYMFAAFKIDRAVFEMCMVRNGLDKKDPEFNKKYLFMEGAIKVMMSEGKKKFDQGCAFVQARKLK